MQITKAKSRSFIFFSFYRIYGNDDWRLKICKFHNEKQKAYNKIINYTILSPLRNSLIQ